MASNIPTNKEFLKTVEAAQYEQFKNLGEEVKVEDQVAFKAMKDYITASYHEVEAEHSFEDENGSIFDCIPVNQQPALKGLTPAKAPSIPLVEKKETAGTATPTGEHKSIHITSEVTVDQKDKHGNVMSCPEGYIPMRRITLEEMTRFSTIQHFFRKSPLGEVLPPKEGGPSSSEKILGQIDPKVASPHRYAHATQFVNNLGGQSNLNVWDPQIAAGQIFSLSQQWYVGGSGKNQQTVEVGWQVCPRRYGHTKPVLFIYWTADSYQTTGCYNLDCKAFVQISNAWPIGGALPGGSIYGGAQRDIQIAFYLHQGNWWLHVGGTAIGYYPTSIYKGGALASHASRIDYGGEVVGSTSFPPMGSGHFAKEGWAKACYQADIRYYPTAGGAVYANLNPSQSWPNCYTVQKVNYAAPWNATIYFGGPGGNC